ncbi:uncharacterized protein F4822DRAFT_214184 [Hypoxylon trugodes]|uniref:uncharacterized protein n=1 Tax=Hypoxylon trugodes TaxID=326681 RepID=UPI002193D5E8|nr:uncharacterized protein F4822DRAFT_214184 [Hypoxylon trugodes]KAI1389798.1 hypothetical protein F4822DRAFT_214184 [Hypoxylon trugodes]
MCASEYQLITPPRTPGLQRLPYEIMAYIVKYLTIDQIFNLSLCSRHFQYLVREESFCRAIMTAKASYTLEAREAQRTGHFSRALRRVAKRHQALAQASPYILGIVGVADSFEYIHGILCYIVESRPRRWLRILDLHGSASLEVVIDIPALIREAVPRSAKSRKYKFRVLYHASGITSCLFSFALPNTENWLLIIKAEKQEIIAKLRLESTSKIFVRNNEDYLYFGTHSEEGVDGFRNWVLTGFNIQRGSWFPRKMHLASVVGYELGSTVCFEIWDGHFYGLSNQTDFELREADWVSYYHCFRFPLHDPNSKMQTMKKDPSWRREHAEGPIDDRWGFLKLEKDEASGRLHIIESRKEWLAGISGSRRSYYITEVFFDDDSETSDDEEPQPAPNIPAGPVGFSNRTIEHLDKHNMVASGLRPSEKVHPGDDSSMTPMFTRGQTHLRFYQRCSNTYLDLVDDASSGSTGLRRLRLRTGHREQEPLPSDGGVLIPISQTEIRYQPNQIHFWPPDPDLFGRNAFLDGIYGILNPPGCLGSVTTSSDERSIVYATGEDAHGLKVLVYLSFDPAAKLTGMLREKYILGQNTTSLRDGNTNRVGYHLEAGTSGSPLLPEDAITIGKSRGKLIGEFRHLYSPSCSTSDPSLVHTALMPPLESEGYEPWAWAETAMYQNLAEGCYTFAH